MTSEMELSRRTWLAAVRLGAVLSALAAVMAIALTSIGEVSQVAIILAVVVVAFSASWIQTTRIRRSTSTATAPAARRALPIA